MNLSLRHLPLLIVALSCVPSTSNAHVLDEYLQSTLVAIEPGDIRLRINLTPGAEVADQILAQIDHDRDGRISNDEATAYAELLKRDLTVRLDGRDAKLKLTGSNFPKLAELRTGHGIIQVEFSITPSSFKAGAHRLVFENGHFKELGVYLFNAARPRSASIQIVRQNRNANQSSGEIEFASDAPSISPKASGFVALSGVILFVTVGAIWRIRRNLRSSLRSIGTVQSRT